MGCYEIEWKHSTGRDLRNIGHQQIPRIFKAIGALADDPFSVQCRKLRGSERLYRVRVGDYRVIYQVDPEARTVINYYIRHQREAYRKL